MFSSRSRMVAAYWTNGKPSRDTHTHLPSVCFLRPAESEREAEKSTKGKSREKILRKYLLGKIFNFRSSPTLRLAWSEVKAAQKHSIKVFSVEKRGKVQKKRRRKVSHTFWKKRAKFVEILSRVQKKNIKGKAQKWFTNPNTVVHMCHHDHHSRHTLLR